MIEAMEQESDLSKTEHSTGGLPHFIMIGAMKSGTTSLFRLLRRHPQLYLCPSKEPMFFSRDDVYQRGMDWYRTEFAGANVNQLCGEASTCYSRWPHFGDVAGRIHKHLPDVKLIYMMRHPVERAYSHYGHDMRQKVSMSFDQALEQDKSIIDASLYLKQIEQYLQYFPREQMLLLLLDDYRDNPGAVIRQIEQFLGVESMDLGNKTEIIANKAGDSMLHHKIQSRFKSLRQWPLVKQTANLCPYALRRWVFHTAVNTTIASPVGKRIVADFKNQLTPLGDATRGRLLEIFEQPTYQLEEFLGRRLPSWHK